MAVDFDALYKQDSVDKQLKIEFDGGTITNTELHSQEFELNESLCSESVLRFGCCEASSIKFRISNVFTPLKNKWLAVSETLAGNTAEPFIFGRYKADSDVPTADRRFRDVTAYDAMYDILIADVSEWYNEVLPDLSSEMTMKQFRDSFFAHLGVEQQQVPLPNDSMTVQKTVDPSKISGQKVITAICELNGCFGHIGRDGKFQYIFLQEMQEGLYPRNDLYPRDDLFPADPANAELISNSHYITASYEDFTTTRIDKLQIRQEEDDIGCIVGTGSNCYVVQDNFLVYGKSAAELQVIAENLYAVISKVWYRPAHVVAKGNPCLEVGTGIRLRTRYEIIYTYILERNLKGIQSLRDTYDAAGEQFYTENFNTVNDSIVQLRGKTNRLLRNVEETNSRITDVQAGLQSEIQQTAESITSTVSAATSKYDTTKDGTTYNISLYGYSAPANSVYPPLSYNGQYYLNNSNGYVYQSDGVNWSKVAELNLITDEMNSKIEQTARSITQSVSQTYLSKTDAQNTYETQNDSASKLNSAKGYADAVGAGVKTELNNTITQTASALTVEINKKVGNDEFSTKFKATAESVSVETDKFTLKSSGWRIGADGSFELGGRNLDGVYNAAMSYSAGDDYIALRAGMSFKLNGIPMSGQRYLFDFSYGTYGKYNDITKSWEDLTIGSYSPSFNGTGTSSGEIELIQFPYFTMVSAVFYLSADMAKNSEIFSYVLPPYDKMRYGNRGAYFNSVSGKISVYREATTGQVDEYASFFISSYVETAQGKRYRAVGLSTDRKLGANSSSGGIPNRYTIENYTYPSKSISLDYLLQVGEVYE